jgi:hypothetical protein
MVQLRRPAWLEGIEGWPLTATVEICCAVAAGVAALAAWTDGLRGEWFGVTVGVRDPLRPLALAVVLLAARWFIARRRESPSTVLAVAVPRVMAGAVLVAGVLAWIHYLSPYLGGPDSYGYVSAGERIRSGALVQREALAHLIPDPDAAIPLGYVGVAGTPGLSVPAYPLGLPALMALASLVGERGPFFVPLFSAAVLVAVCFWLVQRWTHDTTVAIAAAAAVAVHPVLFAFAIQPMSDVTAAMWFVVAAALLLDSRTLFAAAGGAAAAMSMLTRPAQLPACAALILLPFVADRSDSRRRRSPGARGRRSGCRVPRSPLIGWCRRRSVRLRFLPANAATTWDSGQADLDRRRARVGHVARNKASLAAAIGGPAPALAHRTYDDRETRSIPAPCRGHDAVIGLMSGPGGCRGPAEPGRRRPDHRDGMVVVAVARTPPGLRATHTRSAALLAWPAGRAAPCVVILASLHSGSLLQYRR